MRWTATKHELPRVHENCLWKMKKKGLIIEGLIMGFLNKEGRVQCTCCLNSRDADEFKCWAAITKPKRKDLH